MLVMLIGQTRVLYAMASDGCCRKFFFLRLSIEVSEPEKYHSGGICGSNDWFHHTINKIGEW